MEIIKREAKKQDDALNLACEFLNVNKDEVYYYFEEISGVFGKKYAVYVVTKYDIKDYIIKFLNDLTSLMNEQVDISVGINKGCIYVYISALNSSLMIGRDGKNLFALETILRQSLRAFGKFDIKVNVDIDGYKERKEFNLVKEVKRACTDVLKTKIDVKFDPMNSYERMIIHNTVSDFSNLVTVSEGEEPLRYVVIKYKD